MCLLPWNEVFSSKISITNFNKDSNRIENKPPWEFGGVFNRSIALFKKAWVQGFIRLLLTFNEDLSAMEVVKVTFRLGNKNWLMIFGLFVVMGLVAELDFILCFVGIFFKTMLSKISVSYMYKDGVGFLENDDLSKHNLNDFNILIRNVMAVILSSLYNPINK